MVSASRCRQTPDDRRPDRRRRAFLAALALALFACLGVLRPVEAQTVRVAAGEHADFTRIVLQSRNAFPYTVDQRGTEILVQINDRPIDLDPARIFALVRRDRLAAIRAEGGTLVLSRTCACASRIFEDRPGVLVIDLRDDPIRPEPDEPSVRPTGGLGAPPAADGDLALPVRPVSSLATAAGRTVALRLARSAEATDRAQSSGLGVPVPDPGALSGHLAAEIARGLTAPSQPAPAARALGQAIALPGLPELPQNLQFHGSDTIERRPDPEPVAAACPEAAALGFLSDPSEAPFVAQLSALRGALFLEFDLIDPTVGEALLRHYLAFGLGAEARHLLASGLLDVAEQDLLGGVADLLDGIATNRRARLAALDGCPGPAGLLAALAAGPSGAPGLDPRAAVGVFQSLPAPLREVIGPELARLLLHRAAIDEARIVVDAILRSLPSDDDLGQMLAAEIERGRGDLELAHAHASAARPTDLTATTLQLEIELEQGRPAGSGRLADAVALAEADRTGGAGPAVTALAIRHHAAAGRVDEGLTLLDRYQSWRGANGSDDPEILGLRELLWSKAASLPDMALLGLVLQRDDWRGTFSDPSWQTELGNRLADFGLSGLLDAAAGDGAVGTGAQILPAPVSRGSTGTDAPPAPQAMSMTAPSGAAAEAPRADDAVLQAAPVAPSSRAAAAEAQASLERVSPDLRRSVIPEQPSVMAQGVATLEASDALRRELRALGLTP